MNKKIVTFLMVIIICFSAFSLPVFAYFNAEPVLELAKNNLSLAQPSANDGMLIAALRMVGAIAPLDEKSTNYLWAVNDTLSGGGFVYTPDTIIGVTAAGVSAEKFMDGFLLKSLGEECKKTSDPTFLSEALLALACGGYSLPEGYESNQSLVDRLRATQGADGGFGVGGVGTLTATAKALTALAYYKEYAGVTDAVNNGGGFLVVRLSDNGSFPAEQGDVLPVTAMCVTGLSVNGFDASQLTESAANCLDYIKAGQNPDGGFGSYVGAGSDRSNTIKATVGVFAYTQRALSTFNFSKDLSDTIPEKQALATPEPQPTEQPIVTEPPEIEKEKFPIDIKMVALIFAGIAIVGAGIPILIIKLTRK